MPASASGISQSDAVRALARLAVNIVDADDTDDVSTAVLWNPIPDGGPTYKPVARVTDPPFQPVAQF